MKLIGSLLAAGLTMAIVLVIVVYSFIPSNKPVEVVSVEQGVATAPTMQALPTLPPPTADTSQLEAALAQREAAYQQQISQLEQALQERQTTYQTQIESVAGQLATVQSNFTQLQSQEQALLTQVADLETTRNERLVTYQTQLQQAQAQYQPRFAELQTRINELQQQLAEANAVLGQ